MLPPEYDRGAFGIVLVVVASRRRCASGDDPVTKADYEWLRRTPMYSRPRAVPAGAPAMTIADAVSRRFLILAGLSR
jgi:hypothetical protein